MSRKLSKSTLLLLLLLLSNPIQHLIHYPNRLHASRHCRRAFVEDQTCFARAFQGWGNWRRAKGSRPRWHCLFSDSNYTFEELQAEERWTRFLVRIQRERERERERGLRFTERLNCSLQIFTPFVVLLD